MKAKVRKVKLKNLKGQKIESTKIRIQDAFDEFFQAKVDENLREKTLLDHKAANPIPELMFFDLMSSTPRRA